MWWLILFLVMVVLTAIIANMAAFRMVWDKIKHEKKRSFVLGVMIAVICLSILAMIVACLGGPVTTWGTPTSITALVILLVMPVGVFLWLDVSVWSLALFVSLLFAMMGSPRAIVLLVTLIAVRAICYCRR